MNQKQIGNPRLVYERNVKSGSANLLYFSIFTVVNIVLLLINADLSFLFSAYIPQVLIALGREYAAVTGSNGPLIVFGVISVVYVAGCILSAVMANKNPKWLILGAVLTTLDTVFMLVFILPAIGEFLANDILSLAILFLFHAWILYYVFNALISYKKLKALPPEPQTYEAAYVVNDPPTDSAAQ